MRLLLPSRNDGNIIPSPLAGEGKGEGSEEILKRVQDDIHATKRLPRHSVKKQATFTNIVPRNDVHVCHSLTYLPTNLLTSGRRKAAFTLAEVLITLTIIGVVAALTIPTMITNYQKSVVENRVKKFYSLINQAVRMSVAENGETQNWSYEPKISTYDENVEYLKTYFLPYLKYVKYEKCQETIGAYTYNYVCVYLPDGSLFDFNTDLNGTDIRLYVNGKLEKNTRNYFVFQFNKKRSFDTNEIISKSYVEPYIMDWDGNYETLIDGHSWSCNTSIMAFCTKLIEQNDWKITKDYPW